jgi:hypothetical protein
VTFRVGQKVVCVDDKNLPGRRPWRPEDRIRVNAIYTVRDVLVFGGEPSLRLVEHTRPNTWLSGPCPDLPYLARRFRPVVERKTDISIFTEILNGTRVPERHGV